MLIMSQKEEVLKGMRGAYSLPASLTSTDTLEFSAICGTTMLLTLLVDMMVRDCSFNFELYKVGFSLQSSSSCLLVLYT
jgi:hypothetical protein